MPADANSAPISAELWILAALAFFLPLAEAPKNILCVAYAAIWLWNRARERDFGGPWDRWDTLIGLWIASGFLSAAFAGLPGSEWRGALDLLRYGGVLWLVKRSHYADREVFWVLGALVASTVAGLAIGYWRLAYGLAKSETLQLHSVGHVNHTAIYLAIMLGLCVSWLFAQWQSWEAGRKVAASLTAALVLVSLVVTTSRGAIGVGLLALPLIAAGWWRRSRAPLAASTVALAIILAGAAVVKPEVMHKHEFDTMANNVLAFRDGMWRMGFAAWERYPWFGVGMDNYSLISREQVKSWREAEGKTYDESQYMSFPHGHSLYVNTLAERGAVGVVVLLALLVILGVCLVRNSPDTSTSPMDCLLWGGAAAAWVVSAGVGAVNTTLHHEHGILAALLLGLWLQRLTARRASS